MKAKDVIVSALEMSRDWAVMLAEDLADAPMTTVLPDGGHHAMWLIGHAAHSEGGLLGIITGEPNPLDAWGPLFQQGSHPTNASSKYPPYREVLDHFSRLRAKTIALASRLTDTELDARPNSLPAELAGIPYFATVGSVLLFTAMHQLSHFGQLADIRRRLGRAPLLGAPRDTEAVPAR